MNHRFLFIPLFLFSLSSHASDYYAGLSFGLSSQDVSLDVIDTIIDPNVDIDYVKNYRGPDDSALASAIFFGYRLGLDTALEIGFSQVAEVTTELRALEDNDPATDHLAKESMESSSMYVALVGFWPIYEQWTLHGKLGISSWQFDFAQQVVDNGTFDPVRTEAMSDSGSDVYYGLGASYGLNPDMEIVLGLDIHSYRPSFVNINVKQDMTVLYLGARLHF